MALPTLNLLKLRALARDKSGVSVNDYSNAKLDDQLNIGYVQLATMLANLGEDYFEEQNTKFSLVANSGLYSLPTDFMAMKRVRLAYSGTPLSPSAYVFADPYDPSQVDSVAQEENVAISNPIYDITGQYFRIKPKPSVAVTNGGRLDYIAMPSALAATADVPVIPIQYHEKISVWAGKEMAFKFEKWNKHARLDKEWAGVMTDLENKIAERDLNKPVTFRGPMEGRAHRITELG